LLQDFIFPGRIEVKRKYRNLMMRGETRLHAYELAQQGIAPPDSSFSMQQQDIMCALDLQMTGRMGPDLLYMNTYSG
jgi:hypothetical protein